MKSLTAIGGPRAADIRHDLRAWPGARSIRADHDADTYAPTTLAAVEDFLLGLCGGTVPAATVRLLRRAETDAWCRDDADALFAVFELADAIATQGQLEMSDAHFAALDDALAKKKRRSADLGERNKNDAQAIRDHWLAKWDKLGSREVGDPMPKHKRASHLAKGNKPLANRIRAWVKARAAKK